LSSGIVGGFRCSDTLDGALAELGPVGRDLLLNCIRREGRQHGAAAGQDAEE
jgi:hypothetical protein